MHGKVILLAGITNILAPKQPRMNVRFTGLCYKDCACARGSTSHEALQQCCTYRKAVNTPGTYFRCASFRPGQLEAILPILHGKDVLVRIPTGGGKSLCMFLGVLLHELDKFGVIINPLIGLWMRRYTTYVLWTMHMPARWGIYLVLECRLLEQKPLGDYHFGTDFHITGMYIIYKNKYPCFIVHVTWNSCYWSIEDHL